MSIESADGIDAAISPRSGGQASAGGMTTQRREDEMLGSRKQRPAATPTVQIDNERVRVTEWRFAPGTADRARHLKDGEDFLADIAKGTLPAVTFYKPAGRVNEHPSYTDLAGGDEHIADVLTRLRASAQWSKMVVIVTYDENGGFWDHLPPPSGPGWGDRWGPGTRVPTLIVSPFARRGYVDKTPYDTTSILKFMTRRFGLEPLPGVRANAGDLSNAFEFSRP